MIKKILALYVFALLLWCLEAGNPLYYFFNDGPPGQGAYLLSKCVGFLAIASFFVQVILGVMSGFKLLDVGYRLHAINAVVLLVFVIMHPLLFFTGVSIRSGDLSWGVFIPNFGDYFHAMVGLGILSVLGIICSAVSGLYYANARLVWFRKVHYLSVAVGGLSVFHALSIGSETRNVSVLVVMTLLISSMLFYILHLIGEHRKQCKV